MKACDGLIIVWMNVASQYDDELHDWYEGEHVAEVAAIDGVHSVRRFIDPSHALRYMAMFECADETVEPGPGFQAMVGNATPWTQRIRKLFGEQRRRGNYRLLTSQGSESAGEALLVVQSGRVPTKDAAERAGQTGCTRYRSYVQMPPANSFRPEHKYLEIYDFPSAAAAEAARPHLDIDADADLSVRIGIGTPAIASS